VPVEALISNLEAGLTLDEFFENFPTVTREQALQVPAFTRATLGVTSVTALTELLSQSPSSRTA
jgi:uncharacterized protein (DUF433 family)